MRQTLPLLLLSLLLCACGHFKKTPPPFAAKAYIDQAQEALSNKDEAGAIRALKTAERAIPSDIDISMIAGLYQKVHDYHSAVRASREMTRRAPENPGYWIAYAAACVHAKSKRKALTALGRFEKLKNQGAELMTQAAELYFYLGKVERAEDLLQTIGRSIPSQWVKIAQSAMGFGFLDLCRTALSKTSALASGPLSAGDRKALLKAGKISLLIGDAARARDFYATLTRADVPPLAAWVGLAESELRLKNRSAALAAMRSANRSRGKDAPPSEEAAALWKKLIAEEEGSRADR